jgi:PAS domain S-box-containing protein
VTEALRVLIIEDSPTDAKLVASELRRTFPFLDVERVEDAGSMRAALLEKAWDVVLCDWSMPTFSGPAAMALMKEIGLDTPFIYVAGSLREEAVVEALRSGAHDYLVKDQLSRLPAIVEREVREGRFRADLRRRRAEQDRFFDLSLDLLCIAGFDGYFKRLNPAWQLALGWTTDELLAKPWLDFVHPADREATVVAGQGLESGITTVSFENRYRHREGDYRHLSWKAVPYQAEQVIYAIARDVTERQAMEEELRRAHRELERRLAEETEALRLAHQALAAAKGTVGTGKGWRVA